jgi:hypothetical protein
VWSTKAEQQGARLTWRKPSITVKNSAESVPKRNQTSPAGYIELQQLQVSGRLSRAADVRRIIRALERELVTVDRLGEGLKRWL